MLFILCGRSIIYNVQIILWRCGGFFIPLQYYYPIESSSKFCRAKSRPWEIAQLYNIIYTTIYNNAVIKIRRSRNRE